MSKKRASFKTEELTEEPTVNPENSVERVGDTEVLLEGLEGLTVDEVEEPKHTEVSEEPLEKTKKSSKKDLNPTPSRGYESKKVSFKRDVPQDSSLQAAVSSWTLSSKTEKEAKEFVNSSKVGLISSIDALKRYLCSCGPCLIKDNNEYDVIVGKNEESVTLSLRGDVELKELNQCIQNGSLIYGLSFSR